MGFQQTLQQGQPTASSLPENRSSTTGIDFLNNVVKAGANMIGSSYAEAKVEDSVDAVMGQYAQAKQRLGSVEQSLFAKTQQYANAPSPELQQQIVALEDNIRRIKAGGASGALSGLAVSSRIDGAYKAAMNKFPAFKAQLAAHRDSVVSGGNVAAAIAESDLDREIAVDEAKRLAVEMNKYGLSYGNLADRIQFMQFARTKGESQAELDLLKGKLDPYITEMDYRGKVLELEQKSVSLAQSRLNYDQDLATDPYQRANAYYGALEAELDANFKQSTYDWRVSQKQMDHADAVAKANLQRTMPAIYEAIGKNNNVRFNEALAALNGGGMRDLNVDQKIAHFKNGLSSNRSDLVQVLQAQGIGSTEQTRILADYDARVDSMVEVIRTSSPEEIAKMQRDTLKVQQDLGMLNNGKLNTLSMMSNSGLRFAMQEYSRLVTASQDPSNPQNKRLGAARGAQHYFDTYLDGVLPEQMYSDMEHFFASGEARGTHVTAALAAQLKGVANLSKEEVEKRGLGKTTAHVLESGEYLSLQALANAGTLNVARKDPNVASIYGSVYERFSKDAAQMLVDGYSIKWNGNAFELYKLKKGEAGDEQNLVSTFNPDIVGLGGSAPGFGNVTTLIQDGVNVGQLANTLKELDYAARNGVDILGSRLDREHSFDSKLPQNTHIGQKIWRGYNRAVSYARDHTTRPAANAIMSVVDDVKKNLSGGKFDRNVEAHITSGRGSTYLPRYKSAAEKHNIPVSVLVKQGAAESGFWDNDVVKGRRKSPVGAVGVAQFMPATAKSYNIDPLNVDQSIDAQAKYLRDVMNRGGKWNDITVALVDYNAGFSVANKFKNHRDVSKLPEETRNYLNKIL
jgi:hypothetical protein